MSHSKFGLRTFGLCLLATLSLMAVTATGAQANGHWFVNLVLLNGNIGVDALEGIDVSLVSTFGAGSTAIKILCGKLLVHNGIQSSNGSGSGTLLFSSCVTYINNVLKPNCNPVGTIESNVKSLLIKHNNDSYILFSPNTELVFTTIILGELCAAGEELEVTGHVVAECGKLGASETWTHEDCENEKVEHEIRQVPSALLLFGDALELGGRAASLSGDAKLILKSPHHNVKWGGVAF